MVGRSGRGIWKNVWKIDFHTFFTQVNRQFFTIHSVHHSALAIELNFISFDSFQEIRTGPFRMTGNCIANDIPGGKQFKFETDEAVADKEVVVGAGELIIRGSQY